MTKPKREWWWPQETDSTWCQETRNEGYKDEDKDADDEEIREKYADGQKYWTGWDHVGDAYEQFKPLADDWRRLKVLVGEPFSTGEGDG